MLSSAPTSGARVRVRRGPSRPWRVGITLAKTALGSAVVVSMLGTQVAGTATTHTDQTTSTEALTVRIDALMAREHCSYTGFGTDVIPSTALLRTSADEVRVIYKIAIDRTQTMG